METLYDFTQNLASHGKNFFSKREALDGLGISENQFVHQVYRLSRKKVIRRLVRDFFMILPPEYRALGSLPSHWIIDPLMRHLSRKYYIGLLSAAALYGVAEQQPMAFQVIVEKRMRKIRLPRGVVEFHMKNNFIHSEISSISAPTGYVNISTKEQTLIDLIRYYEFSGGMSNVALVVKDLAAECRPMRLKKVLHKEEKNAPLQRLGYILALTKYPKLAHAVESELLRRKIFYVPLRPDFHTKTGERLVRWKIILNDYVELS